MTVVSTFIFNNRIALASDSLLTQCVNGQNTHDVDKKKSKIVRYEKIRAAACYFGLAKYDNWATYDWLKGMEKKINNLDIEQFVALVRDELAQILQTKRAKHGIGIHIVGFEEVSGYRIPELFLISNFLDINYQRLGPMGYSRQTYSTMFKTEPQEAHRNEEFRLKVKGELDKKQNLVFNNGNPAVFTPVAEAIYNMLKRGMDHNDLEEFSDKGLCHLARRPVDLITKLQTDFFKPTRRTVGGKPHDLCINANGTYTTTTGD